MVKKIRVNMVSESDISVQAHGVHTAYDEMAKALERRDDVELIRGEFNKLVDCDIVHFHSIGPRVWRKLYQKGPKKVISAHIVPASFIGSLVLAKYWSPVARRYMRWFYNRGDKVLAVSGTVAEVLRTELKVPSNKIEVFYNTIDMARYAMTSEDKAKARRKLKISAKEFVVIGNGQVQPRKRLDVFFRMAKEFPDVHFIWVGGIPFKRLGADYVAMQHLMDTTPKNLTITGVISHDDVLTYLAAADVFCLPAEQENHPMAVLEAAGAGLPIIVRDIPEYDDTFKNDALRCTDDTFNNELRKLHDDKAYYKKWLEGSHRIAERFDSNIAAAELVKLYRGLL